MEFDELIRLIDTVSASRLSQFSYEKDGVCISMKKEKRRGKGVCRGREDAVSQAPEEKGIRGDAGDAGDAGDEAGGNVVSSPLVGTFYCAPDPDSEPFVKVGDHVDKGQALGIVEAMKLMNEIESEYEGVVRRILVSNGDVVEFGQPLFVIGQTGESPASAGGE